MADNMIERLRALAASRATDTALVVVDAQGDTRYDYAALDRRAAALAAFLQRRGANGERALLLMDSGVDYVSAFFGCLYANVIAVPAYPPESQRAQHLARLQAIAADADARFVLTTQALAERYREAFAAIAPHATLIAVDALDESTRSQQATTDASDAFVPHRAAPSDVAFLQYTSGSTSTPKGVMVTHGSLWANEIAIKQGLGVGDDDVFVSWLPLYHDMGLIGSMSQPVFSGIPLVLMSPQYFLERPVRWLEAIARHRGTISGGPDFSYRLCADRVNDEQRAALDLSTWRVAFSGSEPVRKATLDAFVERFAASRFDASALYPCYGLAEATLFVTGVVRGAGVLAPSFAEHGLAAGRALLTDATDATASGVALVSCGTVVSDHVVQIVDRQSGAVLEAGALGEILVGGPSVAAGYWNRADDTARTFIERAGERWLRTGDLGFLHDGNLYVAGRLKDLLIVRGRNLYPQDLELTIEREVELVRRGRVAAFAVQIDGVEGIGIAAEVSRNMQKLASADAIAGALTEAIALACGEPAAAVVLLNPGGLPRTSSGKVQRAACVQGWNARSLDAYAYFLHGRRLDAASTDAAAALAPRPGIEAELASIWGDALRAAPTTRDDSFFALGGNSLAAVQVTAAVAARWQIGYAVRDVFRAPVLKDAAAAIETLRQQGDSTAPLQIARLPDAQRRVARASNAQRSLWLTWASEPASAAYNMSGELRIDGPLQSAALQCAFGRLFDEHEILRARFELDDDGVPLQIIDESLRPALSFTDLADDRANSSDVALNALRQLTEQIAHQPFDLEHGPLLRAHLVRLAPDDHRLLIAVHHIVADGWSVNLLLASLAAAYRAQIDGATEIVDAHSSPLQYADFAAWEHTTLDDATLARQLAYWRTQLATDGDAATAARLFERPATAHADRTGRQRSLVFRLPEHTATRLKRFGEQRNASLFMTTLAVFNVALHRLSGKHDIRVGAPLSSRRHAETQSMVGYCISMQVLRMQVDVHDSLHTLVDMAREVVLAAHEHQDVPFDRLVSALLPNRTRGDEALFQVKLTEQRPFLRDAFAPLDTHLTVLLNETPHFDLALDFTDNATDNATDKAGIECLLAYDDAVFDVDFANRFASLFEALAAALVDAPDTELAQLPNTPVSRAEQGTSRPYPANDVLTLWNDSVARAPGKIALHDRERTVSFAELDAAADALACQLRAAGVTDEARIGVYAGRSAEQVLGMLAAFKAGATWVPLDPQMPAARIAAQLADCGAVAILYANACPAELATAGAVSTTLPLVFAPAADAVRDVVRRTPHGERAAYLIYTSGSTGTPKGVVISQRALADYVQGLLETLGAAVPGADASFAMVSTPAADLGHTVLFGALCSGRTLHLLAPELAFTPDLFAQYMARHRVDVLKIVPSHLAALLSAAHAEDVLPAQALILGGEATPAALLERIETLKPACRIFNHYGPTETTIGVAMHARASGERPGEGLPLGMPLPNARLYVLDERMNRVPVGTAGELYLGGPGVARGYYGRAQLTAERFVPDPFVPGARVYRSGDLAQLDADGTLRYLGRSDDQVKVRGYRVEPAEIERVLLGIEGVRAAAVLAHDAAAGKRLAAFVTGECDSAAVLTDLAQRLPDYMVPADLLVLRELPLNANGKLDRAALLAQLSEAAAYRVNPGSIDVPRGAAEIALAQIWAGVLGVDAVTLGREMNFFEAGGDSILGLKVVAKAKKAGLKVTPKQLFERRTLAEIAASALPGDKRADASAAPTEASIRRLPDGARMCTEASYAQQRQWFLWQLSPESSAYHVAGGLRLRGEVNAAALRTSFEAIVARHEVLRTRFVADDAGRVEQRIEPAVELDWREVSLAEEALDEAARALASEPFDLTHGPLLRVALFSVNGVNGVNAQEHLLVLSMHHIVSDGWSVQVLLDELVAHYRAAVLGEPLTLAPLPVQYTDYATWQREWLDAGERERQLTYWRSMLGDEHPVLALPTDAPRPAHASFHAARHGFTLPAVLADAIRAQAQRNSATPFTVLLAAFHALLYRYTGQAEVRTGVPVANRHRVETEGLIGFFVNTQVLASRLDASTHASGLLAQVREATLGAQSHQDLPFDVLVDALHVQRSLSHSPLFQVMFNHQRRDWRVLQQLPGMTIEPYRLANPMAQFELLLDTREEADGTLSVEFTYARELFGAQTIGRMAQHYERLLEAFTGEGSVTPLDAIVLPGEDERDELDRWSRNPQQYGYTQPVHRLFERHAHAHPDDEALVYGETSLSYGELNARANRLAHWLIQQGIGVETKVGVAAERSVELVVALLAIMKAGAAYVPLDPSYPADRLAYMQADSGLGLLLCQRGIALPEVAGVRRIDLDTLDVTGCANSNPAVPLHGANLAYVIYTSGSTGRPKGVGNRHDALYNRLEWMQQAYGLQRGETVLQKTPFSFDVSVWEFFWPLMVGARLAVAAPGAHRDPAQLAAAIVTHRVSTLHFVPSMLQAFVASGHASRCAGVLRRIVCSGEALPAELQTRVFEVLPEVELHNLYGPTEAAIDVTSWQCRAEGGLAVPIGAPIAATQTWVLDAHMQPVPRGVAGELYLGGAGLARGYLGRPGLTAERFVPDPFDLEGRGARLYRTGDLVRWRADGVLDYLGRLDHQVKIRGFRIELGELEARLVELDGVREAVVIAHEGRLVAYVTPVTTTDAATEALDVTELKSQLARAVPDYMVPWRIVALETLPLGVNGKVERRALPLPQAAATDDSPKEAPHGETETHLAAIWSQLLNVEHIGRHDNFFDLGGNSLMAVRLNARIGLELNATLPLAALFEAPTIEALAVLIDRARDATPGEQALDELDAFLDTL
ncbi:amino acid adenylation domain-containing protein [Paraburkholderia acidicola]|uniref:Amino acid adenylation domain-containing protein n=1 Tax=Paraburkholderia acidicola TaxID=1912599 RepID=A0ABV1LHW4_9BURK